MTVDITIPTQVLPELIMVTSGLTLFSVLQTWTTSYISMVTYAVHMEVVMFEIRVLSNHLMGK